LFKWRRHSCLVAQRLPVPLRIVCGTCGFCHLECSDQPSETQQQTVWVSSGKQMRATFAGPEGGTTAKRPDPIRYCHGRMAGSVVAHSGKLSGADEGSAVAVASKNRLAASTR
jgi:hypothetical protein